MCKKIGIAAIAVVVGLIVLNKTKLGDWAKFGYQRAKEAINSSIPPELEIAKLKSELANYGPKVREHINKMAEAQTAMQSLERDIKEHTARLEQQRATVLALREEVETIKVIGGKNPNKQASLEHAWKSYRTGEESLKAKQQKLEARKAKFEAAKEQLDSLRVMREQLETQIEEMEARLEIIRVNETKDSLCIDDQLLGDIKQGIARLNDRISTMENFDDLNARFGESREKTGSPKASVNEDLLKEIDDHFKPAKGGAKVASDRE